MAGAVGQALSGDAHSHRGSACRSAVDRGDNDAGAAVAHAVPERITERVDAHTFVDKQPAKALPDQLERLRHRPGVCRLSTTANRRVGTARTSTGEPRSSSSFCHATT